MSQQASAATAVDLVIKQTSLFCSYNGRISSCVVNRHLAHIKELVGKGQTTETGKTPQINHTIG